MSSGTEILNKFYLKQWVIGLIKADISEVIRTKAFRQDITWIPVGPADHFYGDPFLLRTAEGGLNIFFEDFSLDENYGNISLMTLDEDFRVKSRKILLDTGSHLSYPFLYRENGVLYVFPESSKSGELSCYEFDPVRQSLAKKQKILDLPLLDSTIVKHNGKYWLFGAINERPSGYRLHIFYSGNLLGPYTAHQGNPLKTGYDGTRSSGNFISVDGKIYRPTQNCKNDYGESMTIQEVTILDERTFREEPYMEITIDDRNREEYGIHNIHTINAIDGLIAVDGRKWTFSLAEQFRNFFRNRRHLQNIKKQQPVIA